MDSSVTTLLNKGKKERKSQKVYPKKIKKFPHEHMFPSAQDVDLFAVPYDCSV